MTSLVATGARPVKKKRNTYALLHVLHDCANLTGSSSRKTQYIALLISVSALTRTPICI